MNNNRPLVCILSYNNLCVFEYGIALEVFALPRPELAQWHNNQWYQCKTVAVTQGDIQGSGEIVVNAENDLSLLSQASLIVVPGWHGDVSNELKTALIDANKKGVRIATICSGVFLPAACGLLNGKRATTHWQYTDKLQQLYPKVHVNPEVLYIDEGDILTSAGSAAGLDLCLYIVRKDFGSKVANCVARRLVLPAFREGGQAQYINRPSPKNNDFFSPLLDEIRTRLDESWSLEKMAAQAAMSTRTLIRRFQMITNETPMTWLTMERLALARELLEVNKLTIEQVALNCGFNSSELLRHHFKKQYQVSPSRYRTQFVKE